MKRIEFCLLVSLAVALAGVPVVTADTLHVAADAQTTSVLPHLKLGLLPAMSVRGGPSGPIYNGYARFDLSPLPADPTVQKAILRLWVLAVVTPGTIEVVPVVAPWLEGTITADSAPALGTPAASFTVANGDALHFIDVDVTGMVQDWSRGLLDNHGLAMRGAESGAVNVILDTKESILHGHAPELEVVLADAGPPGSQGLPGEPGMRGDTGATGAPGVAGAPGSSCWDSNMNLSCDAPTEDVTGDGACTVADCRGPQPPFFGQSCPAGQFVSGFGASGQLLCADPSAPPIVITSRALSLDQVNLLWVEPPSGTFSEKASFGGPGIGHPNYATRSTGGPLVVVVTGLHGRNPQPIRVAILDSEAIMAQNGGVWPGTPEEMARVLAACPGCVLADLDASPPQVWKITGIAAGLRVTVLVGAEGVLDDPPVVPRPGQALVANFGQFSDQFQQLVP